MSLFEELEASGSHLVDLEQLLEGVEEQIMPTTKRTSTRKSHKEAMPVLGAVGMSLSLAGNASDATAAPVVDIPLRYTASGHELTLHEEEIADVSLATFYVFDKENGDMPQVGAPIARRCGGCGCHGCRGCRGCGCGGCGGCGGCCPYWWCGACLPG